MVRYRASWVVPINTPPIRDGWVLVNGEQIIGVGRSRASDGVAERNLGSVAIMPGLVNAHTHLELSYLHNQVPPADHFVTWIRGIMAARRQQRDPRAPEILEAIEHAIGEALSAGTVAVGDISNTLATCEPIGRSDLA